MSKRAIIVPILVLSVAAFLLFLIQGSWTSWEGGKPEQKTDDAVIRADVTPMSTRGKACLVPHIRACQRSGAKVQQTYQFFL